MLTNYLKTNGKDGSLIASSNMVLSTTSIEPNHVVVHNKSHQQIQLSSNQQSNNLQNLSTSSSSSSLTTSPSITANITSTIVTNTKYSVPKHLLATIKSSHNSQPQIIRIASPASGLSTTNGKITTITSTMPSSKLLVLQQTNDLQSQTQGTTQTATNYLNGQDGNNKIVFVTTEQLNKMEQQHQNGVTNNDEELTSLNWLQDKNLLKGNAID